MSAPTVTKVGDALAQHLHNLGLVTYNATGAYTAPTKPAVFFGRLADQPNRAVAISHYNTDPEYDTHIGSPLMRFQLRWRAVGLDPRVVQNDADAAMLALRTKTPVTWPGNVHVLTCWRSITAPIETDSNERWMRADSYEIRLNPIGAQP